MTSTTSTRSLSYLLVLALLWVMATQALAQNPTPKASPWPSKSIKIMVGFPAGTSPDLVARTLAEPLSKALGQAVIVENHPGAGGNIAADLVAKSTDGHTIGVMINGNLTIAKLLNPLTPYEPARDLTPISLIGTAPLVLAAPADAPGQTTAEFLNAAQQAGNRWSYGSPGVGTVGHIGMELLKARAQLEPVHVPYPGYPQVVTAMIGGQIQLSMLPPGLAQTQARAGKVKILGITSSSRSPLVPDVATLAEAGVKNFQLEIWNGVAGPASMPAAVVNQLSTLIAEIVRTSEVRQKLFLQGWQVVGSSPQALAQRMHSDTETLGRIIHDRGIKAE
jgi:tripartite-type tricarboxylate transporter receptor subunit TctC